MSPEKLRNAFEFIEWYPLNRHKKRLRVELTGGEPLLISNFPSIKRILKEVYIRNGSVAITTNGYTLKHYANLLSQYADVIEGIRVTLNGVEDVHNKRRPLQGGGKTFENIVEGIENILSHNELSNKLAILGKVDKENINDLPSLLEFFKKKGWIGKLRIGIGVTGSYGNLQNYPEEKNTLKQLISFFSDNLELLKYIEIDDEKRSIMVVKSLLINKELPPSKVYYCGAFFLANSITFSPDGYVYPYIEFAENKLFPIGQYYPNKQIFQENISKVVKRNILNLVKCHSCELLPVCGGGCPFRDLTKEDLKKLKNSELSLLECTTCMNKELIYRDLNYS